LYPWKDYRSHPAVEARDLFDGFAVAYARAKELQAEAWADQIIEIIDNEKLDPSDRRVKLDGRKWRMSKHAPLAYGDKLTVAGDPDALPIGKTSTRSTR
jgi:hypothetical protein